MAFVVDKVKDTDAEMRKAALLTVCGKKAFALLKTLCAPDKFSEKSFDELCAILKSHCLPQLSVIMKHFKFNGRL